MFKLRIASSSAGDATYYANNEGDVFCAQTINGDELYFDES
ncbi:MAG: hypothetical protein ACLUFP_05520 [Streptococcus salivarius]